MRVEAWNSLVEMCQVVPSSPFVRRTCVPGRVIRRVSMGVSLADLLRLWLTNGIEVVLVALSVSN